MKEISGDLLEIKSGVILHQTNCRGVTGGLAGALRRKWPMAFNGYSEACAMHNDPRGVVTFAGACIAGLAYASASERIIIAHVFGQIAPGPNTDLRLVDMALSEFATDYKAMGNSRHVFAPHMMGCGLGGGHWPDYKALLVKHIPDIIIVRKFP